MQHHDIWILPLSNENEMSFHDNKVNSLSWKVADLRTYTVHGANTKRPFTPYLVDMIYWICMCCNYSKPFTPQWILCFYKLEVSPISIMDALILKGKEHAMCYASVQSTFVIRYRDICNNRQLRLWQCKLAALMRDPQLASIGSRNRQLTIMKRGFVTAHVASVVHVCQGMYSFHLQVHIQLSFERGIRGIFIRIWIYVPHFKLRAICDL